MNSAYLYYYAYTANDLKEMMKYVLYFAVNECDIKFDAFTCLNIMDNNNFARDLKFD